MKMTTGEVISAGIGRLCCPMERVYELMNFLTGDSLFTHQLPRAFNASKDWMSQQCPWLLLLNESDCERDGWQTWLSDAEKRFGLEHEVSPLPFGLWKSKDPVAELREIKGDHGTIVLEL